MRKRCSRRRSFLIRLGLASLLFLIFAWENIQATRLGYRVEQTRREMRSLKITNEYLHYSLESALSPARLHFVAQKRLGMVAPDLSKIVVLADCPALQGLPSPFGKDCPALQGLPSASGEGPVTARDDTRHRLHASIAFHKLSDKSTPNN